MKEEQINDLLKKLKDDHTDGAFGLICLKCGSTKIEQSYDGEGHCVATQSYTAEFNGKHFIKCADCGNASTKEFYVDINGICG